VPEVARGAVLLNAEKRWECPACGLQHKTTEPRPHTPMHTCPALSGLDAPFVEVTGIEFKKHSARLVVNEREDYIGSEVVTLDANGRPIMSVSTERADGSNDLRVYAGAARMSDPRQ
jgi:hypothetical protein